ncbi:MAG: Holliday junction ATP-dependent DNA helicase RuvB [Candidatus Sericytochromatia bacterium]|nr:MAG: Holliday junction ATP-dependent DNA helicase RuvB [Candidatus Sericytochromatia bacterium]GIX40871.1 MAG: Holliday junction ATP-dependent DNA helicase RuvB [Leptospiraceae bacterium]
MNYSLRPDRLDKFIGQKEIIERLKVMLESSRIRDEALDHILLSGPPGLGKTTLANIIANELQVKFHSVSAPTLTKIGDLAKILTTLNEKDILFIDEIHRLNRSCEEVLYSAMEDYFIDIIIGEGITAKSIRIPLKKFTLIGATTRSGYLSSPLRARFGIEMKFSFYKIEELAEIIIQLSKELNLELSEEIAIYIATYCRMTPREAVRIMKRIRDYAIVENVQNISKDFIDFCLNNLGISSNGINEIDKKILYIIYKRYKGGPVGIKTLSSLLDEEEKTILENHEPFLLKLGLIEKTKKGRILTEKGYKFIKQNLKENLYVLEN